MRSESGYQSVLIALGLICVILLGVFLYRELFPEYRIYQNRYVTLEEIRSKHTGEPIPFFKGGVKQIVIPAEDNGPEIIDRCISCHVALELDHFSPTKIARDVNGNVMIDQAGNPLLEPNEQYVWSLLSPEEEYLKTVKVGDQTYDVTKVLRMHPLLGKETRPFEFHSPGEFGCTSCHSGNGRSLVTDRAHGPVFDGQYEADILPHTPQFLERDPLNDPTFSRVFNHKPGERLLFQTTPLLVGNLMQANCVQCHQPTASQITGVVEDMDRLSAKKEKQVKLLQGALLNEETAVITLIDLKQKMEKEGKEKVLKQLEEQKEKEQYLPSSVEKIVSQIRFLNENSADNRKILSEISNELYRILGTDEAIHQLEQRLGEGGAKPSIIVQKLVEEYQKQGYSLGTLFTKVGAIAQENEAIDRMKNTQSPLTGSMEQEKLVQGLSTEIDRLTQSYQRGKELFISQACYACHKIAGFSRGGVGPELTEIGKSYPWYIKESIVWPQADLPTSVMPNMHLDHPELENLMTYLLAQRGKSQNQSEMNRRTSMKAWEEGKKGVRERAISPAKIYDLTPAMKTYALEGCAACHRLKGFTSDVGYQIEKENPSDETLYEERQWFRHLFPEDILGSKIVRVLDEHQEEISQKIIDNVRQGSLLEEIEKEKPGVLESYYSNFAFASRAKNHEMEAEKIWKDLVRRCLLMFIQEYGLGRQIGPRINWSGVYRSDQWLMEHFWNPQGHSARSIMPVFPFDNTKFLSLTHMLDVLGKKNRNEVRKIWSERGFSPPGSYALLCAQCHGEHLQGNGPVSEWIYPIPKNLRDPVYLRSLTRENVKNSITHGVKGTPMPPWGEVGEGKEARGFQPVLTAQEIDEMVDWIFSALPAGYIEEKGIHKWEYQPKDVIEELKREGTLPPIGSQDQKSISITSGFITQVNAQENEIDKVTAVFDCSPDACNYIRKKLYTPENLKEGERLFLLNCSICHGRQGDGSGLRAGTMAEAKPRMLTNLDWLQTRDDLRLLRSIKYGVPGTSMPAWGDTISSLQRLQLVMFIRSLSEKQKLEEKLSDAIYKAFIAPKWAIDQVRAQEYLAVQQLKEELDQLTYEKQTALIRIQQGKMSPEEAKGMYTHELELISTIEQQERRDRKFEMLLSLTEQQRTLFQKIGNAVVNLPPNEMESLGMGSLFHNWLEIIQLFGNHFFYENGKLSYSEGDEEEKNQRKQKLLDSLAQRIRLLEHKRLLLEGKISSAKIDETKHNLAQELKAYHRLQAEIISAFSQNEITQGEEKKIYDEDLKKRA